MLRFKSCVVQKEIQFWLIIVTPFNGFMNRFICSLAIVANKLTWTIFSFHTNCVQFLLWDYFAIDFYSPAFRFLCVFLRLMCVKSAWCMAAHDQVFTARTHYLRQYDDDEWRNATFFDIKIPKALHFAVKFLSKNAFFVCVN